MAVQKPLVYIGGRPKQLPAGDSLAITWGWVGATPTTLAGYGITDALLGNTTTVAANSISSNGYFQANNDPDLPTTDWYWIHSIRHTAAGYGAQWMHCHNTEDWFVRRQVAGTWLTPRKLWHDGNFDPATKLSTAAPVAADLNAAMGLGVAFNTFINTSVNTPVAGLYGGLISIGRSTNSGAQLAIRETAAGVPAMYVRGWSAGTPTAWAVAWTDATFNPATKLDKTGGALSGGLSFGSSVAAGVTDLSRHLALYGTAYGFSITANRFNYVAPSTAGHYFSVAGTDRAAITATGLDVTGAVSANGIELGYRKVPLTTKNATYTLVADDAGKGLLHNNASNYTYTIPAVFAAGDVLTIVSSSTGILTLAGSGVNLFLAPGTSAAGNRTLGARAVATVFFIGPTTALVYGVGVT